MRKNVASQLWTVFAFRQADGLPKTGDAANITANLRLDGAGANATDDLNPAELERGYYFFELTADESNADHIVICPASNTASVTVVGVPGSVWTRDATVAQIGVNLVNIAGAAVDTATAQIGVNTASTSGSSLQDINKIKSDAAAILDDTGTSGVNVASLAGSALQDVNKLKSDVAAILVDTGTDGVNVASLAGSALMDINKLKADVAAVLDDTGTSGVPLTAAAINAIWEDTGDVAGLNYASMLGRAYQVLVNQMSVNNASGTGTLFNYGNTAALATTELTDDSTTTLRKLLTWV